MEAVKKQLEFVVKKEERVKNELDEMKQTRDIMKKQFEEQVHDLRQQKLKLETTLQDVSIQCAIDSGRICRDSGVVEIEVARVVQRTVPSLQYVM